MTSVRDRLLGEHPEWLAHLAERAQAEEALDSLRRQSLEEGQRRTVLEQEHRRQVEQAALDGSTVPPDLPPLSMGLANALRMAQTRVNDLRAGSNTVLAGIAKDVEARAYEEAEHVEADVRSLLGQLDESTKQINALLHLVRECRSAVEAQGPRRFPSRSSQTRTPMTTGQFVELVKHDRSALDPLPVLGMQGDLTGVQIERDAVPDEGRREVQSVPSRGRSF